jgi:prolyl oligopeptidase
MNKFKLPIIIVLILISLSLFINNRNKTEDNMEQTDAYMWLEEVEGEAALKWVREQNARSLPVLENDPRFKEVEAEVAAILNSKDRIPLGTIKGAYLYNFWQDETNIRGVLRRTSVASYGTDNPVWESILDIDALSETSGENWVYKGNDCLAPANELCLVRLSRGGGDAVVTREYNTKTKSFVDDGFALIEGKQSAAWVDENTLLIGNDFGEGSMTTSGYARTIRLLKRGQAVADAEIIFEIEPQDLGVFAFSEDRPEGHYSMLAHVPKFFTGNIWHRADDGTLTRLPFPEDADYKSMFNGYALAQLRTNWTVAGQTYAAGSLVGVNLDHVLRTGEVGTIEVVFAPSGNQSIQSVSTSKNKIYVNLLDNVTGKLIAISRDEAKWHASNIDLPENGSLNVITSDDFSNTTMVTYESFLVPNKLYQINGDGSFAVIKSLPERFDASELITAQKWTTSKDGTKIPYFLVHHKDIVLDGSTPTLLYGYGGFEISIDPAYVAPPALSWLKRGGAYAIGNIRGGGEFGPAWHQAALLENRQLAYDDFIAVAEELISSGVTSPAKLGIWGRSNGGLLMGAMFTQRPDLFSAVMTGVPLLDMKRYNKLLAGASWMAEYGNPDVPEQWNYIKEYSPYQNVSADVQYPEIYFYTSTKDDRVHPGHARKMVAKMTDMGHSVLYYENTEGGHAGTANLKQLAYSRALQVTYLMQKLMD